MEWSDKVALCLALQGPPASKHLRPSPRILTTFVQVLDPFSLAALTPTSAPPASPLPTPAPSGAPGLSPDPSGHPQPQPMQVGLSLVSLPHTAAHTPQGCTLEGCSMPGACRSLVLS